MIFHEFQQKRRLIIKVIKLFSLSNAGSWEAEYWVYSAVVLHSSFASATQDLIAEVVGPGDDITMALCVF